MTTTSDPTHPQYLDEADVRGELTRVFDICGGCRSCVDLCPSFTTLFSMLDEQVRQQRQPDAGRFTPAEQDQVVDQCVQCGSCSARCPYTPDVHEWAVDVPRLMVRAEAMQRGAGIRSFRSRMRRSLVGRPAWVARLGRLAPRAAARLAGAAFVTPRFSSWFATRPSAPTAARRHAVTVFPACRIEYHEPHIGIDLVEHLDAGGIGCAISDAGCCGAPWLIAGDLDRFARVAARNVRTLAREARHGTDIVVPDPTCHYVIRTAYVDHVGGPDAELVAANTLDSATCLARSPGPADIEPDHRP